MRRRVGVLALGLLAGCAGVVQATASLQSTRVAGGEAGDNANAPALVATGAVRVALAWTDVVAAPSSCFFFSGPSGLGRDDALGAEGALDLTSRVAWLRLADGVVFDGAPGPGGALVLARSSTHAYGGAWTVRERISLVRGGGGWVGRYHYDEVAPGTTAPGECHIDASVTLVPVP